jgi:hypothetical protein
MEEQWYADRGRLRELLQRHPDWSKQALAAELERSLGWVKKWCRRLQAAPPDDEAVLWGHSRARKHPPPRLSQEVIDRILAIRDHPPANLQRVPGPRAILYYLHHDADLVASGVRLPCSTRTIWQILAQHGRIAHRSPRVHEPLDRPMPLASWHLDFKDITTVPADPEGKRMHVVEALNAVDAGTSMLLAAQVRDDFTAETTLLAVAQTLQQQGVPQHLTVDRDPRFVGSASGRDFPSPFLRFLVCLGVEVTVCPPHRPDRNAFVERFHRTYDHECLKIHRPSTVEQARACTSAYQHHYNHERPNQAVSCANQPPQVAFPTLPTLPPVPEQVDPDRWVQVIHGRRYVRKVRRDGSVLVDDKYYYIKQALAGHYVVLQVDAAARALVVYHHQQVLKRVPIKGLQGDLLAFPDYLALMRTEARSDWRARTWRRREKPTAA